MEILQNPIAFWALAAALLLGIEFLTAGLTTIWFAGGALAALLCCALRAPVWVQVGVFAGVSVALLAATRPIVVRHLNTRRVPTNADALIGQEAIVTSNIDNLHSTGSVQVNGQDWSARSLREDEIIEKGEIVLIRDIQGVKLIVGKKISSADETRKESEEPQEKE